LAENHVFIRIWLKDADFVKSETEIRLVMQGYLYIKHFPTR